MCCAVHILASRRLWCACMITLPCVADPCVALCAVKHSLSALAFDLIGLFCVCESEDSLSRTLTALYMLVIVLNTFMPM
jgi:hypothetical protein